MSSKKRQRKKAFLLRENKRAVKKELKKRYQKAIDSGDIERMASIIGIKLE